MLYNTFSCWRIKGEYGTLLVMAASPDANTVLTRDQLAEFQRKLSLLSDSGVAAEYKRCWEGARYDGTSVPAAATIQQLVASWRVLRRFQKNRA
jgi:hypothetical protein